ncbi:MAG: hypothetical protein NVV73_03195 [Cellvibrionaceae bacterium]|nr:hypothetical protein [Cellvibrionaceae bacterium]
MRTSSAWRSFTPSWLLRKQLQETLEIVGVVFLRRRELPDDRPQLVAELGHAGVQKALHRLAGLRQHAAVGREADRLEREDAVVVGASFAHLANVGGLKVE